MANRSRSSSRQYFSPEWFPPGVKWLLIINVSIFLILFFSTRFTGAGRWYSGFQLQPASVVRVGAIWQLVTYCFLHSEPLEIFWNGLYLYWLGTMLEPLWGTKRFLQFYFSCAVGGAVVAIIGTYLFYDPKTPFMGASGAIFGLLVGFGFAFAGQVFWGIMAQYLALLVGALQFFLTLDSRGAFFAHLGGMLVGFAYMLYFRGRRVPILSNKLGSYYKQWKADRARKKFQVYIRKNSSDRDPWAN